jgi:putative ABC transport system permease protein
MRTVTSLAWAAIRRRRLQGAIIAIVLLLATLASTVALDILVGSQAPFEHAFDAANGAHLVALLDGATPSAAISASEGAPGVTDASGPWHVAEAGFVADPGDVAHGLPMSFVPGTISDRADPATTVDKVTILSGRWWQNPGEIVLSRPEASIAGPGGRSVGVGDTIELAPLPGPATPGIAQHAPLTPATFRIVGIAADLSTPDTRAWLSPSDLAQFVPAGSAADLQMLYRVADPSTDTSLAAERDAIAATLPAHSLTGVTTWLGLRTGADTTANLMVPILLAFAAFAFLAAAFIVVNVVSGVVVGSLRQIGLLKAVGATPGQVTGVLLLQVLVPATLGAIAGIVLGAIASAPILGSSAAALGVTSLATVSPTVLIGVAGVALGVTLVAALLPALRGSRLTAVEALTRGASPTAGRPPRVHLPAVPDWVPDPAALGLRRLGARPLRTSMTAGALIVGVAALAFTLGMEGSLHNVAAALFRDHAAPVRVDIPNTSGAGSAAAAPGKPGGPGNSPPELTPAQVEAVIKGEPATARYVAIGEADVAVPGVASPVPFFAYRGDSTWLGYVQTAGRWFTAPGEVDVPDNFLTQTDLHVGDTFTATVNGQAMRLTIVGSIFDDARCHCDGPRNVVIRGAWSTLAAADPTLSASQWEVAATDQLSPGALAHQIRQDTNGFADASPADSGDQDQGFLLFEGVIASLGLILVLVALAGVANTVLLESRERARETAILRAVGMTPRQVVGMVVASVVPLGIVAAIVGIPVGLWLMRNVIERMGQIAIASSVPASITNALGVGDVLVLLLGGLAIALVGAWLPARRSAVSPIAPVLAAE